MNRWKVGDRAHVMGVIGSEVRIMAIAENWAMVRDKGAMPFCCRLVNLVPINSRKHKDETDKFYRTVFVSIKDEG